VGKTTLSCGLARSQAQKFPDQQILLLSTDPAHSLADVLQVPVSDTPLPLPDLPNLQVRALDADRLLQEFRSQYGVVLEQLVERGSFVDQEDLTPVWDLDWPGVDELMGILEIQRLLRQHQADRVIVDMAPSGHTLNLFGLMDFLDELLAALELFQEKHRVITRTFTGNYAPDAADDFLQSMTADLLGGRQLLQDAAQTACLVVAIAEPMSLLETRRFLDALEILKIPIGGLGINHIFPLDSGAEKLDRLAEQQQLLAEFLTLAGDRPLFTLPHQSQEPIGATALDALMGQMQLLDQVEPCLAPPPIQLPRAIPPGLPDFLTVGTRLVMIGGKGGVGKTTVAAAIAWGMAARYPDAQIRAISIDPAHSLGDALGLTLTHEPTAISPNLSGQEVDADQVLEQFRADYLWELAAMMSGDSGDADAGLKLAYGPEANYWSRASRT